MARKIVLLVETAQPGGLSARKMILESLGHHVVLAHSGNGALELLERIHADVVLMHSQIDDSPCKTVIDEIQQRFPHITVVALTPGATILCGSVLTIDSMRPQDLVQFFEQPA